MSLWEATIHCNFYLFLGSPFPGKLSFLECNRIIIRLALFLQYFCCGQGEKTVTARGLAQVQLHRTVWNRKQSQGPSRTLGSPAFTARSWSLGCSWFPPSTSIYLFSLKNMSDGTKKSSGTRKNMGSGLTALFKVH